MDFCTNCGKTLKGGKFCPGCGTKILEHGNIPQAGMPPTAKPIQAFCASCGTTLEGFQSKFCQNCGNAIVGNTSPVKNELHNQGTSSSSGQPDLLKQLYTKYTTEHANSKPIIRLGISNIIIGIINIGLAHYIPTTITGHPLPFVLRSGNFTELLTYLGAITIFYGLAQLFHHNQPSVRKWLLAFGVIVLLFSVVFVIAAAYPLATANIRGGGWLWIFVFEPVFYVIDIVRLFKLRKNTT